MDNKIDPGTEEQNIYNVLEDKITNIFKENLPNANEDEENIFEQLKTRNKVNYLCCIEHIKQRKQVGVDVEEAAKHTKLVKNTVTFRAHAKQIKQAAKHEKLVKNTVKFGFRAKKVREDCECKEIMF